jgi:hypothetical protein
MRAAVLLRALVLATMGAPACAAAADLTLQFTGTLSPGAADRIFVYATGGDLVAPLAGDPLTITTHITGRPGNLYADSFNVAWSDPRLSQPFLTAWSDSGGVPFSEDGTTTADFVSDAAIGERGGSLDIASSDYYVGLTDGGVDLQLTYALGPGGGKSLSKFSGRGRFVASISEGFDPILGVYDESASAPFTLIGLSRSGAAAPEPGTWAMLLIGFAALGCGMRLKRRRPDLGEQRG